MRARGGHGEFSEARGTIADHGRAERYATALSIAMLAARRRQPVDLSTMAARMGYSRMHLWRVLNVRLSPTERFLDRACEAVGCDREMLDTLAGERPDSHPLVQFLTRRFEA